MTRNRAQALLGANPEPEPRTKNPEPRTQKRRLHRLFDVATKPIVVIIAALRTFARLALGRQTARDSTPLRGFLANRPNALDCAILLVDPHRQMPDHLIAHAQAAIDLLHQLTG